MQQEIFSRDPGSFRDPAGCVFEHNGRLFRMLDQPTMSLLNELEKSGWLGRHIQTGAVAQTRTLSPSEQAAMDSPVFAGAAGILEHERLPMLSYPYEWSFSMLADAGLLHLALQEELLDQRLSLKDATAFNVLFNKTKPCFIDLGSIERPAKLDVWYAYGQFCRMFLFPLLMKLHRGIPVPGMFLPELDGVDVRTCRKALGFRKAWSPHCFLEVGLQNMLHRPDKQSATARHHQMQSAKGAPEAQKFNLRRLRRILERLKKEYSPNSAWKDYRNTHSYSPPAESNKAEFIRNILRAERPEWVHDVGCNTGDYARLAAAQGCKVIASDNDHDSIECLYRETQKQPADIYPLAANIAAPTPGAGYLGMERKPLLDRIQADAVMALALTHHLMISARLSLDMMSDLFARLTRRLLIIEYVDPADEMFKMLLAFRSDDFSWLTLEKFRATFSRRFIELGCAEIKQGKRWIIALRLNR